MNSTSVGAITLFVQDPQLSKTFYEKVFEVETVYEDADSAALKLDNLILNLLDQRAAPELITPQIVAGPSTGARLLLTIWVDDTDATCATLAERGVSLLNGPQDRPWGMRTAAFADPDGHVWEVAQRIR